MESYKNWSHQSVKLFKQDSKNQSNPKNNQTAKPTVDQWYKDRWKRPLDSWVIITHYQNANNICGKHDITTDIVKELKEKYLKTAELKQSAMTSVTMKFYLTNMVSEVFLIYNSQIFCTIECSALRYTKGYLAGSLRVVLFRLCFSLFTLTIS